MPLLTQQQFLDELKKVEFKTFPTLTGKAVITGRGLNRKNGYKYCRSSGIGAVVTLPFNAIYNTYAHFYGKKGINASVVGKQLKTYKAYKNFWMDLMVEMKLATQISSSPVTIDM